MFSIHTKNRLLDYGTVPATGPTSAAPTATCSFALSAATRAAGDMFKPRTQLSFSMSAPLILIVQVAAIVTTEDGVQLDH